MGQLYLMIHCTATQEGEDYTGQDVKRWHLSHPPGGRGWKTPGYRDLIWRDGNVENIVPYDDNDKAIDVREVTNGAKGYNGVAIHVCYVGGTDKNGKAKDTRTDEQKESLKQYAFALVARNPDIKLIGHNQVARKACPSFDVPKWAKEIGISDKNIEFRKLYK
jgi:hypothetical protein